MAEHRLVPVEQLEMMSLDERRKLHDERIVTDLTQIEPEFLAQIRANARALYEARQVSEPTQA